MKVVVILKLKRKDVERITMLLMGKGKMFNAVDR